MPVPERTSAVCTAYERFLAALTDPFDEEHDNYPFWAGYKFDREVFD
jgi:hypothetical protein